MRSVSLSAPLGLIAVAIGVLSMAVFFRLYSPYEAAGPAWSPPWPTRAEHLATSLWQGLGQPGVEFVQDAASGTRIRLTAGSGAQPAVVWTTAELPTHRAILVRARWRGEHIVPGQYRYQTVRITLCVTDPEGRWRSDVPHVAAQLYGTREWHEAGRRLLLPEWASTARLAVAHWGVSGTVEVADLAATPQRRRADAPWVIALWWFAWMTSAMVAVVRLDLVYRPRGRAVLALGAGILISVTMPESWFHPVELAFGGRPPLPPGAGIATHTVQAAGRSPSAASQLPRSPPLPPQSATRSPWRSALAKVDAHSVAHLALFMALAIVVARCFSVGLVGPQAVSRRTGLVIAGLLLYGLAAELVQHLTLTRRPDIRGAALNWLGTGLGLLFHEVVNGAMARRVRGVTH